MRMFRYRSLLFASLFGLVCSPSWMGGCRPTSDQGTGESGGGGNGADETGGSGSGGESSGSGGSSQGGEQGGDGGSGGTSTGGSADTGGTTDTGGSAGGTTSAGGISAPSSGGAGGSGSTPTGSTVTISEGKGSGAMVGYGWVALGAQDEISDPTCEGSDITAAASCDSTTWSTTDSLCVSGKIPALPETPSESDYTNNWGISVGLDASSPPGKGIGQDFSTIAISVTGSPTSGLRALVHKAGDLDETGYCLAYTTGPLPLADFAQDCYSGSPTKLLSTSDIPNIDKVAVQVPSTGSAIEVVNLCITGIAFGK